MLSHRSLLLPAVLLIALLAAPSSLFAGTIRGLVSDPDGRPVPGAALILSGPLAAVRTAASDSSGRFAFDRIGAGRYDLRVVLAGFRADPLLVDLTDADDREVTVQLRLAAVAESVVVSASQVEVPLSRTSDSVTVLTGGDLRARQIESVGDALRLVPGLSVASNGGRGSVTSLLPRGGDSDYTLVLVDGIKLNTFGGGFDFSQLAIADIDRIEVVRGPQSALFGSDAIGAVVQIVTRQGGPVRVEGLAEGGSLNTSRLAAAASGSSGAWSWGGSVERAATNGYRGIAPATGERVTNDDWRSAHASASLGWRGPGGIDLRGHAGITATDRGYPGPYGSNPAGAFSGVDRVSRGETTTRVLAIRAIAPWPGFARVRQSAHVSYLDLTSDFTSAFGLSASGTRRLSARTQTDVAVRASTGISAGIEVQREEATSTFITGEASDPVPIHRLAVGLFGEGRYQPNERLSLAAGVRAEYVRRDRLEANPNPFSARPPFGLDTTRSVNPKVSVSYLIRQPRTWARRDDAARFISWTRVRAGAGTGIRPPDAFEIAFTDNPALRPERSRSVEIGLEQAFAGDAIRADVTAFYNRYDDLIVAVGPAMGDISRYRTDNISNATAGGIEVSTAVRTPWGLEARVAYTFLATKVLALDGTSVAPAPFEVGQPLLRRPRHQASLDLVYSHGRFVVSARAGARGRVLDVEPSFGAFGGLFTAAGYTAVDAGLSVRVAGPIEAFARVTNLLNRQYEETLGFPALGRSAMAGIRVAARK